VDEDDPTVLREYDVRPSREILAMESISEAHAV